MSKLSLFFDNKLFYFHNLQKTLDQTSHPFVPLYAPCPPSKMHMDKYQILIKRKQECWKCLHPELKAIPPASSFSALSIWRKCYLMGVAQVSSAHTHPYRFNLEREPSKYSFVTHYINNTSHNVASNDYRCALFTCQRQNNFELVPFRQRAYSVIFIWMK